MITRLRSRKKNSLRQSGKINASLIDWDTVIIDGIHHWDSPDYSDAFISYAETIYGDELTEVELDYIQETYREYIYERITYKL